MNLLNLLQEFIVRLWSMLH